MSDSSSIQELDAAITVDVLEDEMDHFSLEATLPMFPQSSSYVPSCLLLHML